MNSEEAWWKERAEKRIEGRGEEGRGEGRERRRVTNLFDLVFAEIKFTEVWQGV